MALVTALAKLKARPKVLVSASAIGFYGDRGDEMLTEESKPGEEFLPKVALDWEAEARKAEALGMRVVLTRFGIILAKQGGALPQMMKPFQFFVGGKLGSGRQWMSWMTLEDVIGAIRWALQNDGVSGVVNVVAPKPVRNAEFTRELARAMHRPACIHGAGVCVADGDGGRDGGLDAAGERAGFTGAIEGDGVWVSA